MIKLENVKKFYASRCVLDIPELTLFAGKRYALIGPNGSGKSTLLRLLSGVLRQEEGSIAIAEDRKEDIGYMPQRPYAYGFTVLKNVQIALPRRQRDANALAKAALEEVGMMALQKEKGNHLSGGEIQRMAFARMLVRERKLLLLDEPTSATDIAGTELLERALLCYHEKNTCTLVFATHSLAQAERLADEIIFLDHGRILACGTVEDVLYAPENEQIRAFVKLWQLEKFPHQQAEK
ncbi:ABC transporter ATP-binding protein [Christensenellaceae bacterium OttesenSCG-928-M15]|nr:ABC transporter ATP-binding protein [Christensenellaceae bacterium OttesenSCG-928-M15]